jgi:tRNA modification GTPase
VSTTLTRTRHRDAVLRAAAALQAATAEVTFGPGRIDIAAEEGRTAIRALDSLVGRIDVEHILDEIFASFCLGK